VQADDGPALSSGYNLSPDCFSPNETFLLPGWSNMNKWLVLLAAIVAEVVATSSLKASDGFRRLWPSVLVVIGYSLSFYLMSLTLRQLPVGLVYAIWSGVGVMLITLIAWIIYKQSLDLAAIIGMALIVAGVVVMNLFSKSVSH
jgi:small multidrug resistance pump